MRMLCPECGDELTLNRERCTCGYEIPVDIQRTLMGTPPPAKPPGTPPPSTPETSSSRRPTDTPDLRGEMDSTPSASFPVQDNRTGTKGSTPRDEMIGRMVGEYEITELLGTGGMGAVYGGVHPLIGKRVAIKILKPSLSENKDMMGRFLAEAKAVNAIRHPNIVDIFSFGEIPEGSQYFVMEYLEGVTLTEYLKEKQVVSYLEAYEILEQIFSALEAAHKKGIIHRDIKPDNIFLESRPTHPLYVKLLDFGIAKFTEDGYRTSHTKTGVPIGTPFYMSPEQCAGQGVDESSDIYSLGIILYEMFTGCLPFKGESFMAILQAHITQTPFSPSTLVEINRELEQIILWCLKKEKASRPANISELQGRLIPLLKTLTASHSTLSPKRIEGAALPDVEQFSISDVGSSVVLPRSGGAGKKIALGLGVLLLISLPLLFALGILKLNVGEEAPRKPPSVRVPVVPPMAPRSSAVPKPVERGHNEEVTLQVQVTPSIPHTIYVNGKRLTKPIFTLKKSSSTKFELKVHAKGYLPWVKSYYPAFNTILSVELQKREQAIMAPPKGGRTPPPRSMQKTQPTKKAMFTDFI